VKRLAHIFEQARFDEWQFVYLKNRISIQAVLALAEIVKTSLLQGKVAELCFLTALTPLDLSTDVNYSAVRRSID